MEKGRIAFKIFTGKPTGKRPLDVDGGDNISLDLRRIRINTKNWVDSAQERDCLDFKRIRINTRNCFDSAQERDCCRGLVNAVLTLQVP